MSEERLFVAVLTNTTANAPSPELLVVQAAGLALGEPYQVPEAITIPAEALTRWVGAYRDAEGAAWAVQLEDGQLSLQLPSGAQECLYPCSPHEFFLDQPLLRVCFRPTDDDAMVQLELCGRNGPLVRAVRDEISDKR
jgi:hypothetical protein